MAVVMQKFNLNNKSYLVYEAGNSEVLFNAQDLAYTIKDEMGITADLFISVGEEVVIMDRQGFKMSLTAEVMEVLSMYKQGMLNVPVQEIRYTYGYLRKLIQAYGRDYHIA